MLRILESEIIIKIKDVKVNKWHNVFFPIEPSMYFRTDRNNTFF